jgi:cellulose biosynthesis protein BcsQ
MKNLTYVGGSKGGTGKSLFCMALVDYFRKTRPGEEILLIETDSSNPDVGRLYANSPGVVIDGLLLNEEEKGWTAMI